MLVMGCQARSGKRFLVVLGIACYGVGWLVLPTLMNDLRLFPQREMPLLTKTR